MTYTALSTRLTPRIREMIRRKGVTGLALALVDGGSCIWSEGFGFADREAGTAATPRTVFMIGSITKLFTDIAIMQQVEQGRLDLDRPLTEILPEFRVQSRFEGAAPITLRSLMYHHSGLPCDNSCGMWAADIDTPPGSFHEVLPFLAGTYTTYPPDTIFSYSNQALNVLGLALERASGEDYAAYLQNHIFKPLGMSATSAGLNPGVRASLAKGYAGKIGVYEAPIRDVPDGGIYSSAEDMARFLAMVNQGGSPILQAQTLSSMFSPQNAGLPLDFGLEIGLGWFLSRPVLEGAGPVAWHDGGTQHFASTLITLPAQGLGVVILTNSPGGATAAARIGEEALRLALELGRGISLPGPARPPRPPARFAGKELAPFVGEYPGFSVGLVTLRPSGQTYRLVQRGLPLRLCPDGDGWYSLKFNPFGSLAFSLPPLAGVRLAFREIGGERVLALEQDGLRIAIARQVQPAPVPPEWAARAGMYENLDRSNPAIEHFSLHSDPGHLYLEASARKLGQIKVYLQPISASEALSHGMGRFAGQTISAAGDQITLQGCTFQKIK